MSDFNTIINAELDLSKIEAQLKDLNNKKVELDVEIKDNMDAAKRLASNIGKGLKSTKIDTSAMSKQLADSFNITDKSAINKIKKQIDNMMSSLASSWNGKKFDYGKATGFFGGIDELSKIVTKNANIIESKMGIYDKFYDYFKLKKIYVSDDLKKALGGDEYKQLLNDNVGKIVRDARKGMSIDSLWREMTSLFPEHFSENIINQTDQIKKAFEVLKAAREDITKVTPAAEMSPEQLYKVSEESYAQIVPTLNKLKDSLQSNILSVTEDAKTTINLDVDVNQDKIITDIRSALQSATNLSDDALDIKLNLDNEDIAKNLRSAINKIGSGDEPVEIDIQVNKQKLQAEINSALEGIDLPIHLNIDAAELETDLRSAINSITDIEVNLRVNPDTVRDSIENVVPTADPVDLGGMTELERILGNVNQTGMQGQSVFQSLGATWREAFSTFTVANLLQDAIYKVADAGKEAIDTVKELNDATLSLRMATGESYGAVKSMMSGYNELGQELGALTSSVAEGADSYLRQGKTIAETNTLIKDTMVLSKVSNLEAADSTEYLTSAMNGYKVAVQDVEGIIDKVSSIDLASATDAGGLMESMSKVATTADMAGVSMDKLLAMLATTGEVTQNPMSSIGHSFKTIFTRMSDIKAGKLELIDEDGTTEILSDVEQTLANVGIDLRKTVTEYNSYSEVLDNLAAKWDKLTQLQQNSLSKAFAGTRQAEVFRVLMSNYDRVQKYTAIAQNSQGTSTEKFEFYLGSLEAKTNSLKASLEALSTSLISDDLYAGVLDGTKAMVDFTTQTDLLKASLAGIGTAGGLFAFQQLGGWIRGAVQEFSNLNFAMDILKTGNITDDVFENLLNLTNGLSESQTRLVLSSTALSDSQRVAILVGQGMSQAEAQATIATMGLATAQGTATGATVTFSGAIKGLWSTLMANPLILVAAAVTAGVAAFSAYKRSIEEAKQSASQAGQAWSESNQSLEEQKKKIVELRKELESGNLSDQQTYQIKSEILSIQQEITSQYGVQADGVNLVNGNLEQQLSLLNQISAEEAKRNLNENKKGFELAEDEITDPWRMYDLGSINTTSKKSKKVSKAIQDLVKDKYADLGISLEGKMSSSGLTQSKNEFEIRFTGDATEADKVLNDFSNDVQALEKKFSDDASKKVINNIRDNASKSLNINNKILDENLDTYKNYLEMQLVAGNDGSDSLFYDYSKAVSEYNKALLNMDDASGLEKAKENFDAVNSSVEEFLGKEGNEKYSLIFDEISNQLDKATVKARDFKDVLAGKSKETNPFHKNAKAIDVMASKLKYAKLDAVDAMNALTTEGTQKGESRLNALAREWGITAESSTEDIQAFVDVLVEAGLVSGDVSGSIDNITDSFVALQGATQDVITEISAVNDVLSSQATGKSISIDQFDTDELKDYKSALEYVNGSMQLNEEKVKEISKAKAEEEIATNEVAKAQKQQEYLKNAKEIDILRQKLEENNLVGNETVDGIQSQIDALLESNSAIAEGCSQIDLYNASLRESIGTYQEWLRAQNGSDYGDMFSDSLGAFQRIKDTYNKDSDIFGDFGSRKFDAAVDFLVPDSVDKDDTDAIHSYLDNISKYLTFDKDKNANGMDIAKFCQDSVDKGLMVLDEAGENYQIAGQTTMEDFANGLNLSLPLVQAFFDEMQLKGGDFDWADEMYKSFGDGIVACEQSAAELQVELDSLTEKKAAGIEVDDSQIDELKQKLEEVNQKKQELEEQSVANIEANIEIDKQIEEAKSEYEGWKTSLEADPANVEIQAKAEEAKANLDALEQKKAELQTPTAVEITAATNAIDSQIAEIQQQISNLSDKEYTAKFGISDTNAAQKVSELQGQLSTLESQKKSIQVYAETTQATSDIDTVNNKKIDDKKFGISAVDHATSVINAINATIVKDKSFTITENHVKTYSSIPAKGDDGTHGLNGTAHAYGTAMANGNWAAKQGGITLVGELGREIVVDPSTGRWHTVGDNGAEFTNIPAGAIVFNHLQSEALLERGWVNSRGTALASGTAMVTGGIPVSNTNNKNSNQHSSSTAKNTEKASKKLSKAADKTGKAADKLSDAVSGYTDWMERLNTVTEQTFDKIMNQMERILDLGSKQSKLYEALAKNKEYMDISEKEKSVYQSHLDMLKAESGLSDDVINKIMSGALEITKYDEETQKLISEYQSYYEKLEDYSSGYDELLKKQSDLVKNALDNVSEYYGRFNNVDKAMQGWLEAERELWENQGRNAVSSSNYDSIKESMNQESKIADRLQQQYDAYAKQITSLLNSGYMEQDSQEYYEAQEALNGIKEELIKSKSAIIEFEDQLLELDYQKIQNAIDGFERSVSKLDKFVSLKESRDESVNESLYQDQINTNNSQIRANMQLRAKKLEEQALYDVGSTRYQELADEISKLDEGIIDLEIDNESLKDSIYELRFKPLDDAIEKYDKLSDELGNFYDILNEDAFFMKSGEGTAELAAGLALISQQLEVNKQKISDYRTGLDKLQESFNNGVISEKEFNEKSEEYRDGIQNSVKANENLKDSLTDLYMTQMKMEVDALQELNDKRKEALERKEQYYLYDRKIKGESKDLNMLRAQAKALEGVNNSQAAAELKRLNQQIAEKEQELSDIKREHSVDMQKEGYDSMNSDLDKLLEDTEWEIKSNADKQEEIISKMLNSVVGKYQDAYSKINQIIGDTGWVGSGDFNKNQSDLGTQSGAKDQVDNALKNPSNTRPSDIASGTVTDKINNDDSYHNSVEDSLSKDPNTDNRPVAELILSPTSVSLEEGKSTSVKASIRPTDAKNKNLAWKSSNTKVATVSGGTIKAASPGSCQITASTTDGSGKSASVSVTVTKKPEPPKPEPPKPTTPPTDNTGNGGDGIPKIGDAVTYASGRYYYSSSGSKPTGNAMLGKTVYIGHINNKSWATKPYAIYRDKAFKQPLGWVSLDQLKGYRTGSKSIPEDQFALTHPDEIIIGSDGSMVRQLHKRDMVIPKDLSENLFKWGEMSPQQYANSGFNYDREMAVANVKKEQNVNVNLHYDNFLNIDGGTITKESVQDLRKLSKEMTPYIVKNINDELRKVGAKNVQGNWNRF